MRPLWPNGDQSLRLAWCNFGKRRKNETLLGSSRKSEEIGVYELENAVKNLSRHSGFWLAGHRLACGDLQTEICRWPDMVLQNRRRWTSSLPSRGLVPCWVSIAVSHVDLRRQYHH
uniref:Uncharacterized protein n=1 Tax=Sphaerodactylus townsendi TaxID=933632 RepID=A0ACB8FMM4_9SAUR